VACPPKSGLAPQKRFWGEKNGGSAKGWVRGGGKGPTGSFVGIWGGRERGWGDFFQARGGAGFGIEKTAVFDAGKGGRGWGRGGCTGGAQPRGGSSRRFGWPHRGMQIVGGCRIWRGPRAGVKGGGGLAGGGGAAPRHPPERLGAVLYPSIIWTITNFIFQEHGGGEGRPGTPLLEPRFPGRWKTFWKRGGKGGHKQRGGGGGGPNKKKNFFPTVGGNFHPGEIPWGVGIRGPGGGGGDKPGARSCCILRGESYNRGGGGAWGGGKNFFFPHRGLKKNKQQGGRLKKGAHNGFVRTFERGQWGGPMKVGFSFLGSAPPATPKNLGQNRMGGTGGAGGIFTKGGDRLPGGKRGGGGFRGGKGAKGPGF